MSRNQIFFLWVLAAVLIALATADGPGDQPHQGGGGDGGQDNDPPRREITVSAGAKQFSVGAVRSGVQGGSRITFSGDNIAFPDWQLALYRRSMDSDSAFGIRVIFLSGVEYIPDSTAGYQYGGDTLVREFSMNDLVRHWTNFVYHHSVVDANTTIYNATTSSGDGRVTLTFSFTTNTVLQGGNYKERAVMNPNTMKVSITVNNYPFSNANSRLAMRFGIVVANGYGVALNHSVSNQRMNPQDDPRVSLSSGTDVGFFSWNSTMWSGNQPYPVVVSPLEPARFTQNMTIPRFFDAHEVYLSFESVQSNDMFWDPAVGVATEASPSPNSAVSVGPHSRALLATAAAVLAILMSVVV